MSENLHELACALVEEFFGAFHSHLFTQLTYHKRLTAPQLAHKSHLPLRQVKIGLAALIQCRLVYHHTPSEGSSTYQANIGSAYDLLRIGRLVELVRNQHGSLASTILSEAFVLGITTEAELEQRVFSVRPDNTRHTANGHYRHEEATPNQQTEDIQSKIEFLVKEGYLTNVRSAHLQSAHDARSDAEHSFKPLGSATSAKGKKLDEEIQARVDVEVRGRTSEDKKEYGYVPDVSSHDKRPLDESTDLPASKRQKLNGDTSVKINGHTTFNHVTESRDWSALVCVSFQNLVSHIRNTYLAEMVRKSFNPTHGDVLSTAVSQVPVTPKYARPVEDHAINVQQLKDEINHLIENSFVKGNNLNGRPEKVLYNEVERSLAVLAEGEYRFLHESYGNRWSINKDEMDQFVQRKEIARLMSDRMIPPALRIVRMLMAKGKLDEKTLQEIGLLSARDLRQTLEKLMQKGYIDLQEVPRESQRQPNRTMYLWFHDSERVRKVLLDRQYKAMARLLQRLKLERKKLSSTLEKCERTDVHGNEEQIMPAAELEVLLQWQKKEAWMLEEVSRLDESVVLLRDL